MQSTDFERFHALLLGMGELYGKDISNPLLDAYWVALRDWDLADFEAACGHLMKHHKDWMPRPGHFTELREAGRSTVGEAWAKAVGWAASSAYRDCETGDYLTDKAVRAIGGFKAIAMCDEDKLHFLERRFAEHYETIEDATDTREALPQIAYGKASLQLGKVAGTFTSIGKVTEP